MKSIIAALALAATVATAGTVATTKNAAGAMAVLTDVRCEGSKNTFIAYTVYDGGKTLLGCWSMDDNFIIVRWDDGDLRMYPFHIWDLKTKKGGAL